MAGADDHTSTLREPKRDARADRLLPVLILVGGAGRKSHAARPLIPIAKELTIGRGREAPQVDPARLSLADPLLSRAHVRIVRKSAADIQVEDAASLNGSYIDGRRLTEPARLSDGSILFFGGHAAVFRLARQTDLDALDHEAVAPFGPVATRSPALASMLNVLRRLAPTDAEILLLGETGVGKEVYARAIHRASGRKGRFVAINCAAVPTELAESELFGYARGAHSTATEPKPGMVEAADGGTLFLDEIGEMAARLQSKLLRFLQEREVARVGATTSRHIDIKVVAATSSATGGAGTTLRGDFLARLGAEPVYIPPLRERIEDVGALLPHFAGTKSVSLETDAFRALCLYEWPRNVRELQKVIARAVALSDDGTIRLEHLPAAIRAALNRGAPIAVRRRGPREPPSRDDLEALLVQHRGNVTAVARALDRHWNVVWRWLVKHKLGAAKYRG